MAVTSSRSGGPRTAEGKSVASRNAIKTGAYSKITVLPGEDEKQFEALEEQFFKDFPPSDLAESSMVRELSSLTWKKLRLERLEHLALIRVMEQKVDFPDVRGQFNGTVRRSAGRVFNQIENVSSAWAEDAHSRKDFAKRMKSVDRNALDLGKLERESESFFDVLQRCASEYDATNLKASIVGGTITTIAGRRLAFWDYVIEKAIEEADDILWVVENKDKLLTIIQHVKDERLVTFVVGDKIRRAHDDLGRAFFKVLSELRKQQDWRRNRPIDITPEPDAVS